MDQRRIVRIFVPSGVVASVYLILASAMPTTRERVTQLMKQD